MAEVPKPNIEEIEKINFVRVFMTFKTYREEGLKIFKKKEYFTDEMPLQQRMKLRKYLEHLNELRSRLESNDRFLQLIIQVGHRIFANDDGYGEYLDEHSKDLAPYNIDHIVLLMKQMVREWSEEGQTERSTSFQPIIEAILEEFSSKNRDPAKVKILFPGSGLGRLPYELASRGFTCEGNEHSLFMVFASNFILNRCGGEMGSERLEIFPYIHTFDNLMSNKDQLVPILVPEVFPRDSIVDRKLISMSCGDFIEIYSKRDKEFNCVATCFFIDCPPNVVLVTEIIHQILKPGGIWINNGPLRYHCDEDSDTGSIQLSKEDLKQVIRRTGFSFKRESEIAATYAENPRSMAKSHYLNWFFVCIKPRGG